MNAPDGEGLYIFRGIRRTSNKGYMVSVNDICEVRPTLIGLTEVLACFFLGRSTPFRIDLMEGVWQRANINLEGKRSN